MTVIQKIARRLTDDQLVVALNTVNETIDRWVAAKRDLDAPEIRAKQTLAAALRGEYRLRTGEVL